MYEPELRQKIKGLVKILCGMLIRQYGLIMNLEKLYSDICAYYSGDRSNRKEASPEKETNLKQGKNKLRRNT